MLKFFSLSLGLAIALGTCGLSVAGGHGKSLPSGQCETPSPQAAAVPSAQSIGEGCGDVCGPVKKKCNFLSAFKPKPCTYTYEWVLKKKKVHTPWFSHKNKGCGDVACDSCGTTPSAQSYGSPQGWGSGQTLGTTQIPASYSAPQGGVMMPAAGAEAPPAPAGTDAPVAPAVPVPATPPTASNGGPNFLPAGN
jgi:hypothetical protein